MRWTGLALASAVVVSAAPARAQTDDALAAARRLFAEAVADQDAKRYETALDEFRRVAAVKETANVHYRIASCLDALGRHAEALVDYDEVVRLGMQDTAASDAVQASRARAAQLEPSVARLGIVLPADAPDGTDVRVDEVSVAPASLHASLPLDPGRHTLRATARERLPFETAVVLAAGGRVSITVTLPVAASSEPAQNVGSASTIPVGAWVSVGIGGALGIGSVVSLVLRASNMAVLDRDCSSTGSGGLTCPASTMAEVNGAHDAAKIEGPLGIGLGAGALVALGVSAWLFLSPSSRPSSAFVVMPAWTGAPGVLFAGEL